MDSKMPRFAFEQRSSHKGRDKGILIEIHPLIGPVGLCVLVLPGRKLLNRRVEYQLAEGFLSARVEFSLSD